MENNYYVLGIDEAGYGPDIGPLVVTSSLFRLSEKYHSEKFWETLSEIVSKKTKEFPEKVIVSDSKDIFKNHPKNYLIGETTTLCSYCLLYPVPLNFQEFLQNIFLDNLDLFQKRCKTFSKYTYRMCWGNNDFFSEDPLNSKNLNPKPYINDLFPKLKKVIKSSGIDLIDIKSIVLCPHLYNKSITKKRKLFLNYLQFERLIENALKRILIKNISVKDKEETEKLEKKYKKETINFKKNEQKNNLNSIFVIADKLGSKKYYINYLKSGLLGNFKIKILEQNRNISSYELSNSLAVRISFIKEGDKTHFPIALSSVFSKYIRERFIKNINEFFATKIQNLKPTKGYAYKIEKFIEVTNDVRKKYDIATNCFLRKRDSLLRLFD
ncbi:MAG: hypothetical protein WBA71_06675 [Candidatus Humimicrobiia bacterium]